MASPPRIAGGVSGRGEEGSFVVYLDMWRLLTCLRGVCLLIQGRGPSGEQTLPHFVLVSLHVLEAAFCC